MGRYAQQRKRGGHVGNDPGLPSGPLPGMFDVFADAPDAGVAYVGGDGHGFTWWKSRWRVPEVSLLWTESADPVQPVSDGAIQNTALVYVPGHPIQGEIVWCSGAGIALSQWSAFKQVG